MFFLCRTRSGCATTTSARSTWPAGSPRRSSTARRTRRSRRPHWHELVLGRVSGRCLLERLSGSEGGARGRGAVFGSSCSAGLDTRCSTSSSEPGLENESNGKCERSADAAQRGLRESRAEEARPQLSRPRLGGGAAPSLPSSFSIVSLKLSLLLTQPEQKRRELSAAGRVARHRSVVANPLDALAQLVALPALEAVKDRLDALDAAGARLASARSSRSSSGRREPLGSFFSSLEQKERGAHRRHRNMLHQTFSTRYLQRTTPRPPPARRPASTAQLASSVRPSRQGAPSSRPYLLRIV